MRNTMRVFLVALLGACAQPTSPQYREQFTQWTYGYDRFPDGAVSASYVEALDPGTGTLLRVVCYPKLGHSLTLQILTPTALPSAVAFEPSGASYPLPLRGAGFSSGRAVGELRSDSTAWFVDRATAARWAFTVTSSGGSVRFGVGTLPDALTAMRSHCQ